MQFPNEHAARIQEPAQFKRFRRSDDEGADGIHFIFGVQEDGDSVIQSIRFDKKKHTIAASKRWLKENEFEAILFEEASKEEAAINPNNMSLLQQFRDCSVWLAEPSYLQAVVNATRSGIQIEPKAQLFDTEDTNEPRTIAIVHINGFMDKEFSWFGTSTVFIREMLTELAEDDSVAAIMLHVDSPGGSVSGTKELGDLIKQIDTAVKPVFGFGEDLVASAAFWAISQTRMVIVNEMAEIGSIGVVAAVTDLSEMAAMQGIKVHVVSSGGIKGAFIPGTKVTDEMLQDLQSRIDDITGFFVEAVATGRGLTETEVRKLADGRVHSAKDALKLGLVDRIVASRDEALALISDKISSQLNKKRAAALFERLDATHAETEGANGSDDGSNQTNL